MCIRDRPRSPHHKVVFECVSDFSNRRLVGFDPLVLLILLLSAAVAVAVLSVARFITIITIIIATVKMIIIIMYIFVPPKYFRS